MSVVRIYDNPNHPHYGPVRRLWVMLAQLDLLDKADTPNGYWDESLSEMLESGHSEAASQSNLLLVILTSASTATEAKPKRVMGSKLWINDPVGSKLWIDDHVHQWGGVDRILDADHQLASELIDKVRGGSIEAELKIGRAIAALRILRFKKL